MNTNIKIFDFFSGPGSFAQECETGLDTGIKFKTTDVNDTAQIIPPEMLDELVQDHFQRLSMKGIL